MVGGRTIGLGDQRDSQTEDGQNGERDMTRNSPGNPEISKSLGSHANGSGDTLRTKMSALCLVRHDHCPSLL